MRIAIIDDQREVLDSLKNMLEEPPCDGKREVSTFTDEKAFIKHLRENMTDVAIVDINLSAVSTNLGCAVNGIDVARQINEHCPHTSVIFISGQTDFAEELYEARHVRFLKKPVTQERLLAAVHKAMCARVPRHARLSETIAIAQKGGVKNIRVDDIAAVESVGRKLKVHIAGSEPITHSEKLSDFEKRLSPAVFLRCHQSYIVNMNHIAEMGRNGVRMADGAVIPISRRYHASVKETILRKTGGLL